MKKNRDSLKFEFLQSCDLGLTQRVALKADASHRTYERIIQNDGKSVIFMDAPPEKEETLPFINIAKFLNDNDLSAPKVIKADTNNGFLLLEDFGDESYTKILSNNSALSSATTETEIYENAIDALIHLQNVPTSAIKLDNYDESMLVKESMRFIEWYVSILNGEKLNKTVQEEYVIILKHLIASTKILPNVVVLRDFHADNLMWLQNRSGFRKVGLLDFQDAVIGSSVYDLVSLLEDARRDVSPQLADHLITRYLKAFPDISRKDFQAAYSIFGIQRNLKIVGFCAAQEAKNKNPYYLSLLPRVWRYINHDLKHPLLLPMKAWLTKVVPTQMKLYKSHI